MRQSISIHTIMIQRLDSRCFCSFSSAQQCKKSLFKSNKDDSRTEREIAVHDNASVADKLLSCLDSNYCLTLLNPWGPSTIHVDSEVEGRGTYYLSNKSNSIFYP